MPFRLTTPFTNEELNWKVHSEKGTATVVGPPGKPDACSVKWMPESGFHGCGQRPVLTA